MKKINTIYPFRYFQMYRHGKITFKSFALVWFFGGGGHELEEGTQGEGERES